MANILSDLIETQLNQMISGLEATNGTEIAVVTVPETAPVAYPKAFTTELFNLKFPPYRCTAPSLKPYTVRA